MELARVTRLILLALLLSASPAWAATYYVNASTGDDTRTAATAQNAATPWASVVRATGQYTPGGSVQFLAAAGDTIFVGAGTYDCSLLIDCTTSPDTVPCHRPSSSGSAASGYITFKSVPGTTPALSCSGETDTVNGVSAYGVNAQNYIVWDGFSVPASSMYTISVTSAENVIIRNAVIVPGPRPNQADNGNYAGLKCYESRYVLYLNNSVSDVYTTGAVTQGNTSGAVQFSCRDLTFKQNNFLNVAKGAFDKEGGQDNIYEYNYFVVASVGIQVGTQNNARCAAWSCASQRNIVRFNVIRGDGISTTAAQGYRNFLSDADGIVNGNTLFYNNTVYRFSTSAVMWFTPATTEGGYQVYNNIFVPVNASTGYGACTSAGCPGAASPSTTNAVTNCNTYFVTGGGVLRFGVASANKTLATWTSDYGFDANSLTGDPLFTGASSTPNVVGDFRLQSGSPARNAGAASSALASAGTCTAMDQGAWASSTAPGRQTTTGGGGSIRGSHLRR